MLQQNAELSLGERKVLEMFISRLKVSKPKTKKPVVVGLIGLVGSGKTLVATALAKELGATVISADEVRIVLRKKQLGYGRIETIVLGLTESVLARGGSVVVDSDFASADKRNRFKKSAKDGGAEIYFVRTVKKDVDTMIGIAMTRRYGKEDGFFVGASTTWKGKDRAAVVKLREMWRRIPHHYLWSKDGGGQWIQKTIQNVYATVDTSNSKSVLKQVRAITATLKR